MLLMVLLLCGECRLTAFLCLVWLSELSHMWRALCSILVLTMVSMGLHYIQQRLNNS